MLYTTTGIQLKGIPLSPGVAWGRACFYGEATPFLTFDHREAIDEAGRLNETLTWMVKRLEVLAQEAEAKLDSGMADVFRMQRMILEDPNLQQRLFAFIEHQGLDAERAVEKQLEQYQIQLQTLETEYLRQRAADIAEIKQGLLDHLRRATPFLHCKDMPHCEIGECRLKNDHIVIASELTSHLLIEADCHVKGFLVEKGGIHSHAAILARALGLPVIGGIQHPHQAIPPHAKILINGDTGKVILNPSAKTLHQGTRQAQPKPSKIGPIPELQVMVNIDTPADLQEALTVAAEGIGLYRTETEVLMKGRLLTETEQEARYTEVVKTMAGRPVYIRLLDLGADKAAPWLRLPPEENPALGCRGARLLLSHPEILREQARALARASIHGPIHVIYPMVTDRDQFHQLHALFNSALTDLPSESLLHGIMFEVPSAYLQAGQLFQEIDFGCIGTNDLVQYLFAADRTNDNTGYDALLSHPVLWELIQELAKAAQAAAKPLSLCGELGGNAHFTQKIIAAGIQAVSANPKQVFAVRQAARRVTLNKSKGPSNKQGDNAEERKKAP
ncbi:phosphoenolpyruvate-protein phosphotransferase [Nitrosococcus halophilus Nc 4]|uniref:Phosphoenolpyruvate-protein phosphotransferase n=1 Tax=Nitrosococcus halophilus (strain Nc4) TaxID=472759 RepID=D5C307_NITHN|nr:putative PEP-binding protein [Nitrosococcus halophilus]ADE14899.1 phosphoenolpyruvate-protein phosphotransferase [Nitrosococcus halophilus Nc 4]